MPALSCILFHISSAMNAVAIPLHIKYGVFRMNPALRRMANTPDNAVSRASAQAGWDYVVALLAALAMLLNHMWATSGGPKTLEEKGIIWITVIVAGIAGWRFFKVKEYSPL
ncbi:hypothetical protein HBH56_119480 [Parastagonospora nodorum]|nr:hypothetical protein HBH56_119480 [Parastagonospora nodorum]KAH3928974.1 hypothetical protein HBH54_129710 [Parastagonospora nodorum]KAH4104208.1 hypothetical protein HBH46_102980 [Parastagonospora nodorum]KAH4136739.1 hypothetical protein HBH45_135240 [Parastagonospora nodorum]KAH4160463.1 hypothetical protein HBH44_097060 [Parastagonospora nodorum]